jgi:regulator of replication initiation timing
VSEIPRYYSQDAVDAQYEQMMKKFGILGEEIEKLKAENKQLKEERDKLKEILDKHVLMKMYPAKCTDEIQVFESREEYDNVMKFIWKLTKEGKSL